MEEPTDEELIAFAARLLGTTRPFDDEQLLRETIRAERALWLLLYHASHGVDPPTPPAT